MASQALATQGTRLWGLFSRTVSITATASPLEFVRAAGSFTTDGFKEGMRFTTNATGNTATTFTITGVTTTALTVSPAPVAIVSAFEATFDLEVPIGEMTDFQGPGGTATEIDVTHLASSSREFRMGLRDGGSVTCEFNFVPGDIGQVFLRERQMVMNTPTAWRLDLSDDSTTIGFDAFVMEFSINGTVDDKVSASANLRVTGDIDWSDVA